jgi:hypothetical protein
MADNNPFFISTEGTGITFGQIDDLVDFPHSGIIKALNQMSRGNFAVKGANNFNITQSSSDPIISVATGTYFRDGKQFTTSQAYTFNAAAFTATSDNSYYLIVVDSSNVVRLRVPTATNRVAQFTLGDTIIALLEYSSSSSNGARRVQFFTTDKVSNDLSVGYDSSGYTEAMTIEGDATRTLFKNKIANADVRFVLADNTADERFEIYSDDDSDGDEGDTALFTVNGLGATSISGTANLGTVVNAGTDTDKFLVLDSGGNVDFRTGTEVRSDIGAGTLSAETDTLQSVTNRSPITTTDITCGSIISNVNQNISYEEVNASSPIITGTKSVSYIHDISTTGNTVQLPVPASGNILHIVNFYTNTVTIVGNPLINKADTTHPKITAPNIITLEPFEHVTLQGVNDGTPNLQLGHMIISDGDKDRSSAYATAAQGAKADSAQQPPSEGAFVNGDKTKVDSALQTNKLVRYGLNVPSGSGAPNKALSSGSRYNFTSGDFTAYSADATVVTFSGEDITLKGAGIFEVNLYGYFIANTASGQLILDLSIGDGNQFNRYAYLRNIITLNDVVRMSHQSVATIITTGDTIIKLSGLITWGGSSPELLGTGSADPYTNNVPNNTAFTIRKVA